MAYTQDFTTLFQTLSQRFGEEIGCMVQGEIESILTTQGVNLTDVTAKLAQLETALNGAADGTADGSLTIAQNLLSQIGVLANLTTTEKGSLVGAINELKSAIDSGAYNGTNGASAYDIAVSNGFVGTEAAWVASLQGAAGATGATGAQGIQGVAGQDGANGIDGVDGKSAYQLWLDAGNTGTNADFLASLKGLKGDTGAQGAQGAAGVDGKSAYQLWLAAGNTGTESEFLASLKGLKGDTGAQGIQGIQGVAGQDGATGAAGASAYEVWLAAGNTGSEAEFLASLQGVNGQSGTNGTNGSSAYDIAVANGFVGTEVEWLASLQGQDISATNHYTKAEDDALLGGKVDKSEVSSLLTNAESLVSLFKTGLATGKQARINGTCAQLGGVQSSGTGGL